MAFCSFVLVYLAIGLAIAKSGVEARVRARDTAEVSVAVLLLSVEAMLVSSSLRMEKRF